MYISLASHHFDTYSLKNSKPESEYLQNLDALRFLAFFAVFIHHIFSSIGFKSSDPIVTKCIERFFMNGQLGVSFFFVLSGFLITYLLLKEKNNYGKINISHFYMRRILRIWPLYFLILFIGFVLVPIFTGYRGSVHTQKDLYVFFLGNFDLVKNGVGNFITSILWSVSVEEQFYLIWPLLLSVVPLKHLAKFLILLIILSVCYRIFGNGGKSFDLRIAYHTFSCLYNLAVGGLLAYLLNTGTLLTRVEKLNKFTIINIYIIGWTLLFMRSDILKWGATKSTYLPSILPVFYALFFAFIIAEQVYSKNSFFKLGKIMLLSKLGKISYGLYCYHMLALFIVFQILTELKFNTSNQSVTLFTLSSIASFSLTVLLSHLSFHFFEKKFLAYKAKFHTATIQKR